MIKKALKEAYLDYLNNYISSAVYAEHNGIEQEEAEQIISISRKIYQRENN